MKRKIKRKLNTVMGKKRRKFITLTKQIHYNRN